jgi:3-oxoacyl-ACP reductase-like protein
MSIFGSLKDKIFRHKKAAPAAVAPRSAPAAAPAAATASAAVAPPTLNAVDVEAVLEDLAAHNSTKLNWRTSIVDLMKLLDLDSSMANRRALATELGYTGDLNDSAPMNIWLHKAVMRGLAENGGIVPAGMAD